MLEHATQQEVHEIEVAKQNRKFHRKQAAAFSAEIRMINQRILKRKQTHERT
jgi:hypothetical protein